MTTHLADREALALVLCRESYGHDRNGMSHAPNLIEPERAGLFLSTADAVLAWMAECGYRKCSADAADNDVAELYFPGAIAAIREAATRADREIKGKIIAALEAAAREGEA